VRGAFYKSSQIEVTTCLAAVKDVSAILRLLLNGGLIVRAGRLAGAFRRIGRDDFAGRIITTMKAAGQSVPESDPLTPGIRIPQALRPVLPHVNRI